MVTAKFMHGYKFVSTEYPWITQPERGSTSPMTQKVFCTIKPIILASGSPRRRELLSALGLNYTSAAAEVDETPHEEELPEAFAIRMAFAKADSIADHHPDAWVIGADTVVTIDGKILGKPGTRKKGLQMLRLLNGSSHQVYTGLCIRHRKTDITIEQTSRTKVRFGYFNDAVLQAYVDSGDSLDKAGAYGVQGIGSFLVDEITGSCTGVIGLPMNLLITSLLEYNVIEPRRKS